MAEKFMKSFLAKTPRGKANYAIDLIFDELLRNPKADELAHFANEILNTPGPVDKRLLHWARKFAKYRLK